MSRVERRDVRGEEDHQSEAVRLAEIKEEGKTWCGKIVFESTRLSSRQPVGRIADEFASPRRQR